MLKKEGKMKKLAIDGGKPVRTKPFTEWPIVTKEEIEEVIKVVKSGKWWRGAYSTTELDNPQKIEGYSRVEKLEKEFAKLHGAEYAVATSSGSGALEVAVRALGIGAGDEVITTPYTFIATSTCILNNGALPIYVDIEQDTYNINANLIEEAINERTKAILPVHFSGNLANMEKILKIAEKYNLYVIEDACHAHGVEYKGKKYAGTFGDIGCFSFQSAKNMASGEGGMIITNSKKLHNLCYSLHHYGREEGKLWYEHFRLGWNYRMSEFQAAVLIPQCKTILAQNKLRMKNYKYLADNLSKIEGILPCKNNPSITKHSHHLIMLRYVESKFKIRRDKFVETLNAEGIPALTGYTFPNYANSFLQKRIFFGGRFPDFYKKHGELADFRRYKKLCPNTEKACYRESIWLEHRLLLGSRKDMDDIITAFEKVANYYQR